jgi:hypothetical protein
MKIKLSLLVLLVLTFSCKTYTISPENFKKQLIEGNLDDLKNINVDNPISQFEYKAFNLKYLNVTAKNGSTSLIKNSPSIEMRVTLKNGKRKIFYLDTVTLENDTMFGEKSRILGLTNKIPFNEIVKIEVQDGGKNYQYSLPTKKQIISENSDKNHEKRGEILEKFEFKKDTISIEVAKYNNLYTAFCRFEKSQSNLMFIYYLNNNILELIRTREISLDKSEIWWINNFYVENNKIFFNENLCVSNYENLELKNPKYKDYKFNKNLNASFLKKFSLEIYNDIKNYR